MHAVHKILAAPSRPVRREVSVAQKDMAFVKGVTPPLQNEDYRHFGDLKTSAVSETSYPLAPSRLTVVICRWPGSLAFE